MAMNELVDGEYEIWRNDQWRVTNMTLEEIADPELAGPPYWISLDRLNDPMWPEHVCEKAWVNTQQFVEAYRKACRVAGVSPNEEGIRRALNPEPHPFDFKSEPAE